MKKTPARIHTISGAVIMILLILVCIPFTVPKLFGLQLYEVKTESMEPEYPVGSVVYVKKVEAGDVSVGDVITYTLGTDTELVMTHRVMEIQDEEQQFITKGDANPVEDAEPVSFSRVIGTPVCCIKGIAAISNFIHSTKGIMTLAVIFGLVFVMWIVADFLKKKEEPHKGQESKEALRK